MSSAFRTESVAKINWRTDVSIEADGTVVIKLPMSKAKWDRDYYFPLVGEAAVVMRRWISHRSKIFLDSDFLLITIQVATVNKILVQ